MHCTGDQQAREDKQRVFRTHRGGVHSGLHEERGVRKALHGRGGEEHDASDDDVDVLWHRHPKHFRDFFLELALDPPVAEARPVEDEIVGVAVVHEVKEEVVVDEDIIVDDQKKVHLPGVQRDAKAQDLDLAMLPVPFGTIPTML